VYVGFVALPLIALADKQERVRNGGLGRHTESRGDRVCLRSR
jgi:hypothetical protein